MPVYEYQCEAGHRFERILPVDEYLVSQNCSCGARAKKHIFSAPKVFGDYEGYESPATGRWIEGRRARMNDLAASGCQPYEEGMRQDAERVRAEDDAKLDKVVDRIVDTTLVELTA